MGTPFVSWAATAAILYVIVSTLLSWRANILKARASGLNYIVGPCSPFYILWVAVARPLCPLLLSMGTWFPFHQWLGIAQPDADFHCKTKLYEKNGPVYLVVSPRNIMLITNHPDVIYQISEQRERFPKNISMYSILQQFGENVLTTEGLLWRTHRKAIATSFNERNAALVWRESIVQAQGMVEQWASQASSRQLQGTKPREPAYIEDDKSSRGGKRMRDPKTITTVDSDTMKLTLHIISYVGFSLTMLWPAQLFRRPVDPRNEKYTSDVPKDGHTMTLIDSLSNLLEYLFLVLIAPDWLMRLLPFKVVKLASAAKNNYLQYMNEMVDERLDDIRNDVQRDENQGMDLVGHLARKYTEGEKAADMQQQKKATPDHKGLCFSRSDILGNIFIIMVAGHETTANTLHFMFLYLAANPATQRDLVRDLDRIVGSTLPEDWDYDSLLVPLLNSHAGACMNEVLRLMPSVTMIPKVVPRDGPQPITLNGTTHMVPAGTGILMSAFSAARDPLYWPTEPSRVSDAPHDMDDFLPARWFRASTWAPDKEGAGSDSDRDSGADSAARASGKSARDKMYRPMRGSFIPFSEGARSCLGRRIAQVEMMAAMAVVFQKYSIELAVDEWATDIQVGMMTREQKTAVYKKAQAKFGETMKECRSIITLKLHGKYVPVRFVERGQENFVNFVDEAEGGEGDGQ
ncbi:hypothetical protein BROUX41_001323 [Berkeleyomyces rouxiae]